MKTVYKYELQLTDYQRITVPCAGLSDILQVGLDPKGQLCIWCLVQTHATLTETYDIFIVGTGNPVPNEAKIHLGSVVQGPFVWHVFTGA